MAKRTTRHVLGLLLVLVTALALCVSAQAADGTGQRTMEPAQAAAASGKCGKNLTWTLSGDGKTLTISGTGEMDDYDANGAPWFEYSTSFSKIVIQNGVTSIGNWAFSHGLSYQEYSVTFPDTLTRIGEWAFYATNPSSVTIPAGVTSIGSRAFGYCGLSAIKVASGNKNYCSVDGVLFNIDKTTLMQYPRGKSNTSYAIPSGVKTIADSAFGACGLLKSVTIPAGVTSIGENAFEECWQLIDVTIPASVTSIGENAFLRCDSLSAINVASGNKNYCSVNGVLFNKAKTELIKYPSGKTDRSYSIPAGVTSIEQSAFFGSSLTSVSIPSSVKTIGGWAFNGCYNLTSVTIPGSVTEISMFAFQDSGLTNVTICSGVKTIGLGAFNACSNMVSVTIPSSVTSIEEGSFGDFGYADDPRNRLTIHCIVGSYAETYAKKYEFNYVSEKLTAPKLSKVENAAAGIKISWGEVSGAEKYRVFYKPEGGSWTKAGDTTATSYTWTKAKSGTTYQIRVRCISSNGKTGTSDFSASKSVKYVAAPKYTVSQPSTGGIKLSWSKVTGAAKYRVYYKTTGSWKTLTTTTATSCTISKPKNGAVYTFRVRCVDSNGTVTSGYITDKKLTYKAPSAYSLAAPTGVKVSNEKTGIKVTWTKVSGAAKYRVFYKPEGGSWTKAGDTTATSYTWTKAKSGTTYQIRVRCITSDGKTGTSDFSTAKTIKYIAAPKDVKVSSTSTGIKITWTKSAGAAKYRIYYKTGSGSWKTLVNTKSTSYTWTGAKNGTTYTFRVRCVTSDGKTVTSYYTADKTITYKK